MASIACDIVVLGSGFGGSLLSTILSKSGISVALVDSARHPRFAIGESSTPLADAVLAELVTKYEIPELLPLEKYGSWKAGAPDLVCGKKRGFSYFGHVPGENWREADQMLVSASRSDAMADTHWLRSDVDAKFFEVAKKYNVRTFEGADYTITPPGHGSGESDWFLRGTCDDEPLQLRAPYVVDATGAAGVVLKALKIGDETARLRTNSSAIFAHFENVTPVSRLLDEMGCDQKRHPFDCDAAAVHHVLDGGWMWQLRFDDQTVSAGMLFDRRGAVAGSEQVDAQHLWDSQLAQFPFLIRQFADAKIIRPAGGLRHAGRLQRLVASAAGENWAALPGTVGFIDPLHSKGIAHTLFGVRRLAAILTASAADGDRCQRLQDYSEKVIDELHFMDDLIEGCYAALPSFRLWSDWCMLYFAAITSQEQSGLAQADDSFLRADDHAFREMLKVARVELQEAIDGGSMASGCLAFEESLRRRIQPWNRVGLLDPDCYGMYADTAP